MDQKNLESDNNSYKEEMLKKIKDLELDKRLEAAYLYEIFEKFVDLREKNEDFNDKAYKDHQDKECLLSEKCDQQIEGQELVDKQVLQQWKQKYEPNYQIKDEHNVKQRIENYWQKKFVSQKDSGPCDSDILKHLNKIEIIEQKDSQSDQSRIILKCHFLKNDFFTNDILQTILYFEDDDIVESKGTKINWKKNITIKTTETMKKNKRTGQKKKFKKEVQQRTFFQIFENYQLDQEFDENINYDEDAEMDIFELDEAVQNLKDYVPYSLQYYLDTLIEQEDEEKTNDEEEIEDENEQEGHFLDQIIFTKI